MGFKATNGEVAARVHEIKEMLIDGYSRYEIHQFCIKSYKYKPAIIDRYMARAWAEIAEEYKPVRERELQKHIKRKEKLYRAVYAEDKRLANTIDDSLAKLKGLLIDKIEMNDTTSPTEVAEKFSQMVSTSGSGIATRGDNKIPDGKKEIQDGPRGPEKLQDGDRKEDIGS